MIIIGVILLFIIACAVAPGLMQWLFSVALGLASLAVVVFIFGFIAIGIGAV